MPTLLAMAPVIKGSTALPACPKPEIQPIAGVSIHLGMTRPDWFIAIGYIGPVECPFASQVLG